MPEPQQPHEGKPARAKTSFSLGSLVLFVGLVSCVMAILLLSSQVRELNRSLARYDVAGTSTSLDGQEYRILARRVIEHSDAILIEFRVETIEEHFVSLLGGQDGVGSCTSTLDKATGFHVTEASILIDHLKPNELVKFHPALGGEMGHSIHAVGGDFEIADSFKFLDCEGVQRRNQGVDVFEWLGEVYTLTVK